MLKCKKLRVIQTTSNLIVLETKYLVNFKLGECNFNDNNFSN